MSSRTAPDAGAKPQPSPLLKILLETRSAWVAVLVFSMTINILMLAPTIYMMQVSDRVMTSRNMTTLFMLSLLALAIFAVMGTLEWARSRVMVRLGVRLDRRLGAKLLSLSHRFEVEKIADGRRLLSDLTQVRTFLTGYAIFAVLDAPWVPIFIVVTVLLHPTLAVVVLGGAIVMVVLAYFTERTTRAPLEDSNNSAAETSQFVATNMRHGEIIEAMGMFPMMLERWQKKQDRHLLQQAIASDRAGLTQGVTKFVRMANQAIAMGVGGFLFLSTDVSPSIVFAAMLLSSRISGPIEALTATWSQLGTVAESWKRLDDALRHAEKTYSGITLPAPKGEVSLEGVFGGPPGGTNPFVQNVNLNIPAGVVVAIVGSSASGKSTLVRLITGVWVPRMGTVRLDGADLRTWPRDQLGPYIGYVPQDVELIEGTVAENIARLGSLDSEKVIAAARAAGVHDMVLQMADGYGTQVGSNGAFLSGGQRQRIALARAMYGEPPLLVLDEPNANLDEAGELALDTALQQAKQRGQTVIIVSHRPIAIRNCDLILVMQEGQVSLYGPRELVMAKLAAAATAAKG
ncbi:MAG: type I secretion system permease/ATPase [Sulfuritalea sp.]|jgi:ATP-binding cassette subfamily C exporter for protease/lipase|nr:type I secretion system permease/ATPase [Sulfuritalea sp.]